jgi:hypothetical protein
MRRPTIVQFNLSPTLGGAEVYTAFFSRALEARGWPTRVVVNPGARFWDDLNFSSVTRSPLRLGDGLQRGDIALIHTSLPDSMLAMLSACFVVGLAHQTLYDETRPAYYDRADLLLAVSQHVSATLQRHGLKRVHPTALYGVADLERARSVKGPSLAGDLGCRAHKRPVIAIAGYRWAEVAAPQQFGAATELAWASYQPARAAQAFRRIVRATGTRPDASSSASNLRSLVPLSTTSACRPAGRAIAAGPRVRCWISAGCPALTARSTTC